MKPTKYNPILKHSIVSLYGEGLSQKKVADLCGISLRTLQYWIKKYNLKELMELERTESARDCIEQGLRKVAKGAKDENTTEKFIYYRKATRLYIDDFGEAVEEEYIQPVEKTINRKEYKPDVKAIEVLSRKYAKEFDNKAEEREINTRILEGFTMRELQEARKNSPIDEGKFIDAEFTSLDGVVESGVVSEVIENDVKEIDPPTTA